MIVEQKKFSFRKVFCPNDSYNAYRLFTERARYGRIVIMSLEPLMLPGFALEMHTTGVIPLDADYETVLSRFHKTVRKQIASTYREPRLTFTLSEVNPDGHELLESFMKARGVAKFPRSTYANCRQFLARLDGEPVSGIFLYHSRPVPMTATFFSKRLTTENPETYRLIGNASKRLIAEMCKWGIDNRMKGIDIGSLNPNSQTVPGITAYKMSFTPNVVPQYVYTYRSPRFAKGERVMLLLRRMQRAVRLYMTLPRGTSIFALATK